MEKDGVKELGNREDVVEDGGENTGAGGMVEIKEMVDSVEFVVCWKAEMMGGERIMVEGGG